MAGSPRSRAHERGFALLIVLWTLVLVSLIATRVTAAGRSETRLADNLRVAAVLEAAADGAVHEAVFRMLDLGPGGWRADGVARRLSVPGAVVTVLPEDQAGRINPNLASPELLSALLRELGADTLRADAVAGAMLDWRFPNAAARPGGAKAAAYRAAGRDYGPPEMPFRSVGEVGAVLGVTPELLALLAPHLSVFTLGEPDPGLAAPPVLAALRRLAGGSALVPLRRDGARVVQVTATAQGASGGSFARRAVVRVGDGGGQPFQVLKWERSGD